MLTSLLSNLLSGEASNAYRRTRAAAISWSLIGVCVLIAFGFLLAALFIWLARQFGTLETAVGFGVAFLVFALLVWLVSLAVAQDRRKKREEQLRSDAATFAVIGAAGALSALAKSRNLPGILALPVIGLIGAAIYRENFGAPRSAGDDPDDDGQIDR